MTHKHELDSLVETVELTLLSVIQGVALYFFANDAKDTLITLHYEYWVYIAVAFLLLNMFWSQAIVHVMSFISWPLEFLHNFLYFLLVLIEILLFENMTNPLHWFAINILFFAGVTLLYGADMLLLKSKEERFMKSEIGKSFYAGLMHQEKLGLYFLAPAGAVFSAVCVLLIRRYPTLFIAQHWHLALVGIQLLISIGTLIYLLRLFKKQFALIEQL